jgi:hypothetical protein
MSGMPKIKIKGDGGIKRLINWSKLKPSVPFNLLIANISMQPNRSRRCLAK